MKYRTILLFALAGTMLSGGITAASAAAHHQRNSAGQMAAGAQARYCVAQAQPAGSTARPTATCYSTFAASIRAATGGAVRLPASTRPGQITAAELRSWSAVPATTFVLSIDYVNSDFGGSSLTWTQSTDCGKFQASSMPSGWNDVVSSLVTSADCANSLFQNINFGGTRLDVSRNTSRSTLGSFNDLTSSEKWCPSKPC